MPLTTCTFEGKPGYKFGTKGRCFTYTPGDNASRMAAKKKAIKQGLAIRASQKAAGKPLSPISNKKSPG